MTNDTIQNEIKEFREKFVTGTLNQYQITGSSDHITVAAINLTGFEPWLETKLREAEDKGYDEGERQHKLFLKKMTKEELDLYVEKLL